MSASGIDERRRRVVARLFARNGRPRPGLEDAQPLTSADVAALFRMSERAIRLWAGRGELPHMRTLGGGRLLYPADGIAAVYAERYLGLPQGGRIPVRETATTRGRAS
jgi:hypothetical protein